MDLPKLNQLTAGITVQLAKIKAIIIFFLDLRNSLLGPPISCHETCSITRDPYRTKTSSSYLRNDKRAACDYRVSDVQERLLSTRAVQESHEAVAS